MRTGDGSHYYHVRRGTGSTTLHNPNPNSGVGQIAAAATAYFEMGGADDGITSVHVSWWDTVSAATLSIETSNYPVGIAAFDSTSAALWHDEGISHVFAAGAVGSKVFHLGNNGTKRVRLKVVTIATTQLEAISYGVH